MSYDEQKPDVQQGGGAPRVLLPVTPAQERCWFLNKLRPGTPSLNVSVRWEIRGRFPAPAVEQAFRTIIARHEILRTRFVEIGGLPQQEVFENAPFKLSTVDLTMLPEDQRLEQMTEIGRQEAQAPFDLAQAPLIRAVYVRLEEERAFLMLTIHQSAFDGWSIRVLGRELGIIGQAICEGRPHDLPDLPLQYGDYALWRDECLKSGSLDGEISYWRKQLEGAPYFEVEPDKERPPERTPNSAMVNCDLPYEFGVQLEEAAKAQGVSFFNFGSAILVALLHRYTGKTDVAFGTQFAGREETDLESLIGVFINNIVLRNDVADDPTISELVARCTHTARDALINQNMPFHRLVEILNPPRDVQRTPLISVNVILQKAFMQDQRYGSFELLGRPSPTPGALYDFTFLMVGRLTGWRATVEYNTDLFDRETAEQLLQLWQDVMRTAIEAPQTRLSQLLPHFTGRDLEKKFTRVSAIERALEEHADVDEAVAIVRHAANAAPPYAYVTANPASRRPLETLPALLMRHLAQAGGDAPRPAGVSVLAAMPRNSSGDVDVTALPAPPKAAFAPPAAIEHHAQPTDVEAKLIEIWREQLGVQAIDRNSNFFDLGGHSLLAVRMVMQANAVFQAKIDVLTLFRAPTVRQFAEHIAALGDAGDDNWKIVPIQPKGARPPIIALNNTILYYGLAKHLGEDQPFIGVQNYRPDADAPAEARTLEEIASDYVKLIRKAQPNGPYTLVGLCVAGAIAYEVAQQLVREGEAPPKVIMFDSWAPGHAQTLPWHMRKLRKLAEWLHFQRLRVGGLLRGKTTLGNFLLAYKFVQRFMRLAVASGVVKKMPERDFLYTPGFEGYLLRARSAYRPHPYAGDVLNFRSQEYPSGEPLFDANFGWKGLIGGRLMIRDVKGGHLTMCMGDGATIVAEYIKDFIGDDAPSTIALK
ncbi:MAG: condensation domain-containing protein [Hyphomonadaceae bacterium]